MLPVTLTLRLSRVHCFILLIMLTLLYQGTLLAKANVRTLQSKYYVIKTNIPDQQVKPLISHLDLTYREYLARIRSAGLKQQWKEKMTVYLMNTQQDYMDLMRSFNIDGTGSAGMFFFQNQKGGLATYIEGQPMSSVLKTLQHEGFHQFAFQWISYDLPVWLDEGMATYFENGLHYKKKFLLGQTDMYYLNLVKKAVSEGEHIPFHILLRMNGETWGQNVIDKPAEASLQYAQSWSIVHFLVHGGRRYQAALNAYLKALNQGSTSGNAFRKAFGRVDYQAFEKAWIKYVEKLEVDEVSRSFRLLEFYADGMLWMRASGMKIPIDLQKIEGILKREDFWVVYDVHAGSKMNANDPGVFDKPKVRRREARIEINAPRDKGGFPSIAIHGIVPEMKLTWEKTRQGQWVYNITVVE